MKIEQRKWSRGEGWTPALSAGDGRAQLVLLFGAPIAMRNRTVMEQVRAQNPGAHLLGCTTAGEICGTQVLDDSLVATAIRFEHTQLRGAWATLLDSAESFEVGERLAKSLPAFLPSRDGDVARLAHVFMLSDGLKVNGSALVRGLARHMPEGITITGGLAGDGERFAETLVSWDCEPVSGAVAALGLYGARLRVGFASLGGWDPFGPERIITRSEGSVLYELDGQSALALYKRYLGAHAAGLPATGLLFPLSLRSGNSETAVVRTILSVDERAQSLTFAGDVPQGSYARLMKANFDRLIDGAVDAARTSSDALGAREPELAVLISCVGRKLLLKQRIEEEVEGVRDMLGGKPVLAGFYSYGEISPFAPGDKCELHNQTMTITLLSET